MARTRKNGLKTALTMAAILTLGAVFKKQIMELVAKIPVVGDFVKELSEKQESK
ncbi:hypothetical protein [Tenacibaculum ovolyticum]|uniref:hypothetical protein n=1 Tax=Tenacibaculum ovolyticum TaxID=104270 RepID=UPI000AFBA5D1|nr:hypothetical protein [Tenacibaculum ovolyticum]